MNDVPTPSIDRGALAASLREGAAVSIGPPTPTSQTAPAGWSAVCDAFEREAEGRCEWGPAALVCRPARLDRTVVGLVAEPSDGRWAAVFLAPDARGLGLGDELLEWVDGRARVLAAPPSSALADYATARGFRPFDAHSDRILFDPPSRRDDLRPAASVCLFSRTQRRLLLGRRLTAPWPHYWAFPGGSKERGESLLEAAVRELEEETGICAGGIEPAAENTAFVASPDGRRAYRIANFLLIVDGLPTAATTREIEPHWLLPDEAESMRPMAAGTRRVMRKVRRFLRRTSRPDVATP